jgi:3-oxoacyl-[acyl-carrier protein] reductase
MELGLKGKRALVTGASKGIGRATAEALAAEGCDLVLVSRTGADLEKARAEIERLHPVGISVEAADLSQRGMPDRLAEKFPDIDLLVNNAGAVPGGALHLVDEETWRRAWDLKVFGYVNMCRSFYAAMKARGSGTIVNIIGNAGDTRDPDYICGVAGNAALTAFSQALGSTSWQDGIRVLALNPGPVATDRMKNLMRSKLEQTGATVPADEQLFQKMPFGRAGRPEEIAAAVCFLASGLSGYSSGSVTTIDAGLSVRGSFG